MFSHDKMLNPNHFHPFHLLTVGVCSRRRSIMAVITIVGDLEGG